MLKPLRVLLIEDSENDAILLTHHLKKAGYDLALRWVFTSADVQQAIEEQSWDVIIADYNLPQFSGVAVLEILNQKQLDIPFILVSGTIGEEVAVAAMKAGAHDYVMKDNLTRLVPAIERELREAEIRRERKEAEAEVRRQNKELALLNQVIAASTVLSEPEAILANVCREMGSAFDVDRVTATRLETNRNRAVATVQYADNKICFPQKTLPLNDNLLYQSLINYKTPLLIGPDPREAQLEPIRTLLDQFGVASMVLLPLIIDNTVIGSLSLEVTTPRQFAPDEIRLAESVAHQVSGALARSNLDAAHRLLTKAMEQAAESVIITDTAGDIVYVNPAFEKTSGYLAEEVLGQNTKILGSNRHDSGFYQKLWESISTGQVWQGRLSNKKKDGSVYIAEVTISPVRNEQGVVVNFVSLQHDVTREIQLEEQYHQAQKMEAIGQLTAGVAHDFNNLLTAINGFASLLYFNLSPNSSEAEMLEKILNSGERAAELVRQLLAFSRKQVIQVQPLDLNTNVSTMHKILRRIIGEDIQLQLDLDPHLNWIEADPTQIEQVIMNLAINARDAMPYGGTLVISTANVQIDSRHPAQNPQIRPGAYVRLALADTGIGMSDDVKQRIFEPFFTTKEVGKGTGLGLSTVFGIVKQNNGHILVHSQPGTGTTFEIFLPVASTIDTYSPYHHAQLQKYACTETILVVEDDPTVLELARMVLQTQGYTVYPASNAQEALELSRKYSGKIHLLLTDVVMPGINGLALARQLIQIRPKLKVMFMSGYTDTTLDRHGKIDLDLELLQKPFTTHKLINKVRTILDSEQDMTFITKN